MERTHVRASVTTLAFGSRNRAYAASCEVQDPRMNKSYIRHESFIRTEASAEVVP